MKKEKLFFIQYSIVIFIGLLFFAAVAYSANTFPTTENVWEDGDIIESQWANEIENRIGANATTSRSTLTYQVNSLMSTTSFPFLNTIGTITTGVWNGTPIEDAYIPNDITITGYFSLTSWYATTTHKLISSLPALSITGSQVSDLSNLWDNKMSASSSISGILDLPNLSRMGSTTGVAYLNAGQIIASSTLGATYFNRTGDWTGTFDNQEGSYYLNFANLINTGTSTLTELTRIGTTTGITYLNAGQITATTSIGANLFDRAGNWSGVFDNQEGSYYLNFANLINTGTSTLSQLTSMGTTTGYVYLNSGQITSSTTIPANYLSGKVDISDRTNLLGDTENVLTGDSLSIASAITRDTEWNAIDFLVGTASGALSGEIVVGTSPGGSLGGTWASPTIDDLFILNTGDIGTGSYTFPNLSSTNASTTNLDISGYLISNSASSTISRLNSLFASTTQLTTTGNTYLAVSAGNVGIGTTTPGGKLHVYSGASGQTANTSSDDLIVENSAAVGISILSPTANAQRINFGNPSSNSNVILYSDSTTFGYPIYDTYLGGSLAQRIYQNDLHTYFAGNVGIGTSSPGTLLSIGNTGIGPINLSATATSTYGYGINVINGCFAVNGVCVGGGGGSTNWTDAGAYLSPLTAGDGILINSASSTISNLSVSALNATTTNFFANSTSYFLVNNASSTIANLKTNTLAINAAGTLTAPTSFGGRSLTVNANALDADTELYTYEIAFNVGSSTMATTTGSFMQKLVSTASTITGIYCNTNKSTSTIMLEERDSNNPNAVGIDILGGGGMQCGSGSGQIASTTIPNASLDANDIVNLEIIDASPVGGTIPTILRIFLTLTRND